jgi:hypothetical protein
MPAADQHHRISRVTHPQGELGHRPMSGASGSGCSGTTSTVGPRWCRKLQRQLRIPVGGRRAAPARYDEDRRHDVLRSWTPAQGLFDHRAGWDRRRVTSTGGPTVPHVARGADAVAATRVTPPA